MLSAHSSTQSAYVSSPTLICSEPIGKIPSTYYLALFLQLPYLANNPKTMPRNNLYHYAVTQNSHASFRLLLATTRVSPFVAARAPSLAAARAPFVAALGSSSSFILGLLRSMARASLQLQLDLLHDLG